MTYNENDKITITRKEFTRQIRMAYNDGRNDLRNQISNIDEKRADKNRRESIESALDFFNLSLLGALPNE